jgi:hypothetical protein
LISRFTVAIGAIVFDVGLERDGSDTRHPTFSDMVTMFFTHNSLNLLKILIRVVEFYLSKWQWPYIKLRTYIQIMIHLLRRE